MIVARDIEFTLRLFGILKYISLDKKSAAKKFENDLNQKLQGLLEFPFKYRQSIYFEDERYRDLIHNGYTIIYKVEIESVLILDIFKWQER
jgi:plasmid stabilization system protein ParE